MLRLTSLLIVEFLISGGTYERAFVLPWESFMLQE
jgi:hypothetical protein